jgi:hypothetical protein
MKRAGEIVLGGVVLLALVIVLLLILRLSTVHAHDHNRSDLDGWYSQLRSGLGPCCGGPQIDATTVDDIDWKIIGERYAVRLEGEWQDVPPLAVVKEPNRAGRALVWTYRDNGDLRVRCFMPGSLT